tara:strand:+ start:369 stop:629 length:261 start_codon:yes stop_codon:yes gene_type:complete
LPKGFFKKFITYFGSIRVNIKGLEAVCSFLLFGSGATGLMMIWVLVAGYRIDDWIVWPPILLTGSIVVFFLSWSGLNFIKKKTREQ